MKIILRKDVAGVGQKGDIVDVSDGYARNYLMPRGEALLANKGAERQAETRLAPAMAASCSVRCLTMTLLWQQSFRPRPSWTGRTSSSTSPSRNSAPTR